MIGDDAESILTLFHFVSGRANNRRPANKKELFNLRHAKLRNVVERAFGVLKRCNQVIQNKTCDPWRLQRRIPYAVTVIHNVLLINGDWRYRAELLGDGSDGSSENEEEADEGQDEEEAEERSVGDLVSVEWLEQKKAMQRKRSKSFNPYPSYLSEPQTITDKFGFMNP